MARGKLVEDHSLQCRYENALSAWRKRENLMKGRKERVGKGSETERDRGLGSEES